MSDSGTPSARVAPLSRAGRLRDARLIVAATSTRIVLTPVIMALVMADGDDPGDLATAAAVVFCLVAATDWFDGRLARRWGVTSKLGSFLDTTADKLLVTGVLLALIAVERASPWIAAIIIGRELLILGLRGVVAADGALVQPTLLAKAKTTIQFVAIALAIVRPGSPVAGLFVDEWAMLAAAALTLASAADYLARFGSLLGAGPER